MPDSRLERILCRLLPAAARRDLYDPSRHNLIADRLTGHKSAFWYHRHILQLFAECWRVYAIPEWPARHTERTTVFLNDLRYAFRSCLREPGQSHYPFDPARRAA